MSKLSGISGIVKQTAIARSLRNVSSYARLIAILVAEPRGYESALVSLPKISFASPWLSAGRYKDSFFGIELVHTAPEMADPTAPPISNDVRNMAVAAATS